ncbi:RNase P/MRP, p29 subunit [Sparassis crispa]|uniref:RNase P/MRP, p29 subunit n=1 Tax=Sparassis crispa TaxID=139825 RepID=A0A401GJI3_9APHY|nr:RNase P/MRP, p29 subunit [Sparassis crispa]GBE82326.1 RNase P/MRP, p29 subunit [Sparassis crispa]
MDIYTGPPPLINYSVKLASSAPFTPTYVKGNISRSADAAQLYASRVQGRQILLENPVRESKEKKAREERKAKRLAEKARRDSGIIGRRDAPRHGLWRLKREETKFSLFLPLHSLWLGYMSELLALPPAPSIPIARAVAEAVPNAAAMHAKLVKADFHGSLVTVRQSKNPCLVGLSGIVVHETENTFKVVTKNDQLKLIPKQNTIFAFAVPLYSISGSDLPSSSTSDHGSAITSASGDPAAPRSERAQTVLDMPHVEFELYGNQFCFRATERANRKFKHKETIEL